MPQNTSGEGELVGVQADDCHHSLASQPPHLSLALACTGALRPTLVHLIRDIWSGLFSSAPLCSSTSPSLCLSVPLFQGHCNLPAAYQLLLDFISLLAFAQSSVGPGFQTPSWVSKPCVIWLRIPPRLVPISLNEGGAWFSPLT